MQNSKHRRQFSLIAVLLMAGSVALAPVVVVPSDVRAQDKPCDDFATIELDDPWDMNNTADIPNFTPNDLNFIADASFQGGVFSFRTTQPAGGQVHLLSPPISNVQPVGGRFGGNTPINTAKYSRLVIRMNLEVDEPAFGMRVRWDRGAAGGNLTFTNTAYIRTTAEWNTYVVDLNTIGIDSSSTNSMPWSSGGITGLSLYPTVNAQRVQIDFVRLEDPSSCGSPTLAEAPGVPLLKIVEPDREGGEALRRLNFRAGDVAFSTGLTKAADPRYPGEPLSAYLPDVREVDGLRGDFFKGTNEAGNPDPVDFLTFPVGAPRPYTFSADEYRNLCIRMQVDKEFDLGLGSVTKFFFKKLGQPVRDFDAFATIYDRWSGTRWYEYCMDLSQYPLESGELAWSGTIEGFRIDPHEFSRAQCCDQTGSPFGEPISVTYYYDYLKLRKDDESRGLFALVYDVADADTPQPEVSWFYSTNPQLTGSVAIPQGDLQCEGRVCMWNTVGVPAGTYYLSARASDGLSSNTTPATGRLRVTNTGATGSAPVLKVDAPPPGSTYCSALQVKGYALQTERFEDVASVQVFVDGVFFARFDTGLYSPSAVADYPNADASNSGFDVRLPVSSLAPGSHTLEVRAYSTDGGITAATPVQFAVSSGCADPAPVVDSPPSGAPQDTGTVGDDPIPSPTPDQGPRPRIASARHTRRGELSLQIGRIPTGSGQCSLQLLGGTASTSVTTPVKTIKLRKGVRTAKLRAQRVRVRRKAVPRVFVVARTVCGSITRDSVPRAIAFQTPRGVKEASAALRLLGRLALRR